MTDGDGKNEALATQFVELRQYVEHSHNDLSRRIDGLSARVDGLSTGFDGLSARVEKVEVGQRRLERKVDAGFEMLSRKIDGLAPNRKASRGRKP